MHTSSFSESVVRPSGCPVAYDCRLVEEAVFLAVRRDAGPRAAGYQPQRNRVYEIKDPEIRESRFRDLNREWFVRLALREALEQTLAERFPSSARLGRCQVFAAAARAEEMADLWMPSADMLERSRAAGAEPSGTLVVWLLPESLVAPDALRAFLRHEFLHVADMLDPAFGYERTLPVSDVGPAYDSLLRNRYRVLWDATVDGRLVREGALDGRVREARYAEFARTFPMAGDRAVEQFAPWFDGPRPRHQDLVAFAVDPRSAGSDAVLHDGRCPICRFPVAQLDPRVSSMPDRTRRALARRHPSWRIEQGLCSQCFDLHEVDDEETANVSA